jgi:FixJ family two-component response regulator
MHGGSPTSRQTHAEPTVLIVEDEGVARNALRKLLAASGYEAAAYASAEAALDDFANHEPPKVALIDVDLPGMSGLDLVSRLEQVRPGMTTVLITAAGGDRIENFRKAHAVYYIRKPLDFAHLLHLLGSEQGGPASDC